MPHSSSFGDLGLTLTTTNGLPSGLIDCGQTAQRHPSQDVAALELYWQRRGGSEPSLTSPGRCAVPFDVRKDQHDSFL
jgi:hypothetical protein